MNQPVKDLLNRYLSQELGRGYLLPDLNVLTRQREAFLTRFGPERLAAMSRTELLQQLPGNAVNDQPMDYWIEFKNDEEFNNRNFGGVSGATASKFGPWQEKKTGAWRNKIADKPQIENISEDAAFAELQRRRVEILSAVEAMRSLGTQRAEDVDPEAMQRAIEAAAPKWKSSLWLHKYLHLTFPALVTWTATTEYSKAERYRVGVTPEPHGVYARDIHIIRYWNSFEALRDVPPQLRYRCGRGLAPRDHWCLLVSNEEQSAMLAHGVIALGPAAVQDLSHLRELKTKRDITEALTAAFAEVALPKGSVPFVNLVDLFFRLEEGSVITLLSDASTVISVGEITGNYRYKGDPNTPHQLPVQWHHSDKFELATPIHLEPGFTLLDSSDPSVAAIEASLVLHGVGPWPDFDKMVKRVTPNAPAIASAVPLPAPLPPLAGIAREVSEMLDRKRQVILYGPPGTGKTHYAEQIALELVARHNFERVPTQLSSAQRDTVFGRTGADPYVASCTFHPMYSYEDFIEGYRPNGTGFSLEPGIFRRMARAAQAQPSKQFVLLIDEINRGNIPKIFGELITLIEASKRGTSSSYLPLSREPFTVPDNLWIIGTMNTADRSILLLDTALRRRFAFKELLPDPTLLRGGMLAEVPLSTWLRALNRRIVSQLGRDGRNLQIGHAYFMPGGKPATSPGRIGAIVRDEIWPLLQEYCYEDPGKLANILAADRRGIYDRKRANLCFELFEPGREDDLVQALLAIVAPEDSHDEEPAESDETAELESA
ncbi:MAG: AAA family ATPase [Deltaproteobacteria bacterium]|nr:AAA family ATPase [Deltaproteobacteria bacterium]